MNQLIICVLHTADVFLILIGQLMIHLLQQHSSRYNSFVSGENDYTVTNYNTTRAVSQLHNIKCK